MFASQYLRKRATTSIGPVQPTPLTGIPIQQSYALRDQDVNLSTPIAGTYALRDQDVALSAPIQQSFTFA